MRVLVTGATGFVGREIVRELQRANHEIHILTRQSGSVVQKTVEGSSSLQIHIGDISNEKIIREAFEGMEAVIHLVGIISEAGPQTFENVHTRGTQNVVAAATQAGVKRFIHMSALGTRPGAIARYHKSKWAAEEIVRQSGLDWTIFRPSIIYGAGDGFVNLFATIARRSPVVPIVGSGNTRFQPVPVEAVAVAFVRALNEPQAIGQTFDLTGHETLTLNQIVEAILEATGKTRLKVHLPLTIARCQATFLEFFFGRLLHRAPPLNRDQLLMLQEDNVGDGTPAEKLFGLTMRPFREGIACYLANKR